MFVEAVFKSSFSFSYILLVTTVAFDIDVGETKRNLKIASTNIAEQLTNKLTSLNLLHSQNIFFLATIPPLISN